SSEAGSLHPATQLLTPGLRPAGPPCTLTRSRRRARIRSRDRARFARASSLVVGGRVFPPGSANSIFLTLEVLGVATWSLIGRWELRSCGIDHRSRVCGLCS